IGSNFCRSHRSICSPRPPPRRANRLPVSKCALFIRKFEPFFKIRHRVSPSFAKATAGHSRLAPLGSQCGGGAPHPPRLSLFFCARDFVLAFGEHLIKLISS